MEISQSHFSEAQDKAVDNRLPIGGWRVFRAGYEINYYDERGARYPYVEARPGPFAETAVEVPGGETGKVLEPDADVYAPMRFSGLFLEFARLFAGGISFTRTFGGEMDFADAPETILDWVERNGTLGVHTWYPEPDGGWTAGRFDYRESVLKFVELSIEAGRVLQLYEAANRPEGPDADRLRAMGISGDTPKRLADGAEAEYLDTLNKHRQNETFTRTYRHRDRGRLFSGPAFHSLLGAMWLQFAALVETPEEAVTRCRWCGDVVNFEPRELPPSDAPKGQRGKHKTHSNRRFCPSKHGRTDYCKNRYNYERRKKQAAR